jgi:hypothetical protein
MDTNEDKELAAKRCKSYKKITENEREWRRWSPLLGHNYTIFSLHRGVRFLSLSALICVHLRLIPFRAAGPAANVPLRFGVIIPLFLGYFLRFFVPFCS